MKEQLKGGQNLKNMVNKSEKGVDEKPIAWLLVEGQYKLDENRRIPKIVKKTTPCLLNKTKGKNLGASNDLSRVHRNITACETNGIRLEYLGVFHYMLYNPLVIY